MALDRNIPLPQRTRDELDDAQPGDSKGFETEAQATAWARSVRFYAKKRGIKWGTIKAPHGSGWRVWIVGRGIVAVTPEPQTPQPASAYQADPGVMAEYRKIFGDEKPAPLPAKTPIDPAAELPPDAAPKRVKRKPAPIPEKPIDALLPVPIPEAAE